MTNTPHFTEREPYEKGFAKIFVEQIAPKLEDLEQERFVLLKKRRVRLLIAIILMIIGAGISFWLLSLSPDSTSFGEGRGGVKS